MSTVTRTINVATQVYGGSDDVVVDVLVNGVKSSSFTIHDGVTNPWDPSGTLFNYSFNLDLPTDQNTSITFATADTSHSVSVSITAGYQLSSSSSTSASSVLVDSLDDNYVINSTTTKSYQITPAYLASTINGMSDIDGDGYATLQGTALSDYILLGGMNLGIGYGGKSDYLLSGTAHGGAGNDVIIAGSASGNDSFYSSTSPTTYALYGDAGNDTLVGAMQGTGTLDGGAGNDIIYDGYAAETLIGGAGRNTFILGQQSRPSALSTDFTEIAPAQGMNINTISYSKTNADGTKSYDDTVTRSDTIDMSAFSTASFTRDGDDLIITGISQANSSDLSGAEQSTYRVEYYFSTNQPVGKLTFGGQDLRVQDVQQLMTTYGSSSVLTTSKADTLNLAEIEVSSSLVQTGTIHLRQGDDTIYCGSGSNTVYGEQGNDTISNAAVAYGGSGNDTYIFDMSDLNTQTKTTIIENSGVNDKGDVLNLQTVSYDQLWFTKSGKDLVISEIGTNYQATIQNWYGSQTAHVEQIQAGGKTLADTDVSKLVNAMATMTAPAAGQTTLPDSYQTQLSSVIAASWK